MTGRIAVRRVCMVSAVMLCVATNGSLAQEDFRSADLDRPIRVEDAFPLKFREFEYEFGSRGTIAENGSGLLGIAELKAGLFRNTQVGLEVEGGFESPAAGTDSGLEKFAFHVLYNMARETRTSPALAVRIDAFTPGVGSIRHETWQTGIKGIATRSLGRTRLHANGGYMVAGAADGGDYWRLGLGVDYPMGLFSRALLADLYTEVPTTDGRSRVWAELGARIQISNWRVVDVGLATRLDEWEAGLANLEITVGLSRVFGIAGLTPVAPYPNPEIP